MALEDYQAEMERCSQCSYCRWIPLDQIKSWRFALGCPSVAYSHFHTYTARGRYLVARSLLKGQSDYSDRVRDVVFKCQACGSCDVTCKVCRFNLEPLQMILELKARLVADGQSPPEHVALVDHLRKQNNSMGRAKAERGKWAEGLDIKDLAAEKAEVVFHAGCRFSYDAQLQPAARTAVSLLKDAGVDVGILGEKETCCGLRAYTMGYRKELSNCAAKLIKAWERAGVKTVVTSCADCYHGFKRHYPDLGASFEVLHTVEFIDRLIKEGRIKFSRSVPMTVTYHDPCHLGRQGEPYVAWNGVEKKIRNQVIVYEPRRPRYNGAWGVYDPPRDVLRSIPGLELVEMERIREYAWCCGAGGGVLEAYPDFALSTAAERIDEAATTGAEAIVSACPWCERSFLDAVNGAGNKLKVFDVVELVNQAL
ncbi:MAG: (Fe-S)-binding protein [Desulfobacterales bacterium]